MNAWFSITRCQSRTGWARACAHSLVLVIMLPAVGRAERLPIRTYTTADGLGSNVVHRVVRDSRGFLWFCTREGLSQFDGYRFKTYGTDDGLPSPVVNDLLETREGVYWVATRRGLVRFDPVGQPGITSTPGAAMFTTYRAGRGVWDDHVTTLFQDRAGVVWVGTLGGLYRVDVSDGEQVKLVFSNLGIPNHLEARVIRALSEDPSGALWVGAASGIYRRLPGGHVERYTIADGLPSNSVRSLLADGEGGMWVGTRDGGLARLTLDPISHRPVVSRVYTTDDGLPTNWINRIFQTSDGGLWAGSNAGLLRLLPTADDTGYRVRTYGVTQGLPYREVLDVTEDRNGSLWVGTLQGGAARISIGGFTIFDAADGLQWTTSLLETRAGDVVAVGGATPSQWSLNRFTGERFVAIQNSAVEDHPTWGWNQTVVVDRAGDWWVATRAGLFRFSGVHTVDDLADASPTAIYTTRHGLAADVVLCLFEDSRGDVWISVVGHGTRPNGLSRWERQTATFHHFSEDEGLPSLKRHYVSAFAEDRAGNVWVGFSGGDGGLARHRGGHFTRVALEEGVSAGAIRDLILDPQGRLWVASYQGGLGRCDTPDAERLRFTRYTTADGLSSNEVHALAEDGFGRIYAGTARGIDQLDPATGRVRHYFSSGGLPVGGINAALCDRHGALWVSYATGLVRLLPERTSVSPPLPALITGVRIEGSSLPISVIGQTEVGPLDLPYQRNQVEIDFVAPGSGPGEMLRYQVRLGGADRDWSEPSDLRSVNYASLSPGAYHFLVRVVNADGRSSDVVSSFTFTILPPIWRRWWFLTLTALTVVMATGSLYRYRVTRLLEVANLRTRIATDLHDDIGANLTRIAVLSEVLRQESGDQDPRSVARLSSIAALARESITSVSDIVWAIDPERDHLQDLTRKMREHAEDLFARENVALTFSGPDAEHDRPIGVRVRRDLSLIFKEAINNVARHSGCSQVHVTLHADGSLLSLEVRDDGIGFNPQAVSDGHGLLNMQRRADRLKSSLELRSCPGEGTTMRLRVFLHPTFRSR